MCFYDTVAKVPPATVIKKEAMAPLSSPVTPSKATTAAAAPTLVSVASQSPVEAAYTHSTVGRTMLWGLMQMSIKPWRDIKWMLWSLMQMSIKPLRAIKLMNWKRR